MPSNLGYHDKYDHNSAGTRFVFDFFYDTLAKLRVDSNLVALPGKDFERYVGYSKQICRSRRAKAYFVELFPERVSQYWEPIIEKGLDKRVHPITGNILILEHLHKTRIQDIGIGEGFASQRHIIEKLLHTQSRAQGRGLTKAQMTTTALRGHNKRDIKRGIQSHLEVVGLRMKSINGISVADFGIEGLKACHGKIVHEYEDAGKTARVYQHQVVLEKLKGARFVVDEAELYMFTCLNGSNVLQMMLVYKKLAKN